MNVTTVKALQPFVHGSYTMNRDDVVEMPTTIANDLAAAGLVLTVVEKVAGAEAAAALQAATEAHDAKVASDAAAKPAAAPTDMPEEAPVVVAVKAEAPHANKAEKPAANKSK